MFLFIVTVLGERTEREIIEITRVYIREMTVILNDSSTDLIKSQHILDNIHTV